MSAISTSHPARWQARRCQAVQYSDMMECRACGLSWDANDSYPPQCKPIISYDASDEPQSADRGEMVIVHAFVMLIGIVVGVLIALGFGYAAGKF